MAENKVKINNRKEVSWSKITLYKHLSDSTTQTSRLTYSPDTRHNLWRTDIHTESVSRWADIIKYLSWSKDKVKMLSQNLITSGVHFSWFFFQFFCADWRAHIHTSALWTGIEVTSNLAVHDRDDYAYPLLHCWNQTTRCYFYNTSLIPYNSV